MLKRQLKSVFESEQTKDKIINVIATFLNKTFGVTRVTRIEIRENELIFWYLLKNLKSLKRSLTMIKALITFNNIICFINVFEFDNFSGTKTHNHPFKHKN